MTMSHSYPRYGRFLYFCMAVILQIWTFDNVYARLPFADSFESYPPGFSIAGTNGWQTAVTNAIVTDAVEVTDSITHWAGQTGAGYPLPSETHTRAVRFGAPVSNVFDVTLESSLWFDLLMAPDAWTNAVPPPIPSGAMCAFYATASGHLMAAQSSSFEPDAVNQWTELPGIQRDSSGWLRLSVNLVQGPDRSFFAVNVDGEEPITSLAAFTAPSETAAPGGMWFACANFHSRLAPSAITLSGVGVLDDITVSGNRPEYAAPSNSMTLITTLFDARRGVISTDSVIEVPAGTNVLFLITAAPYFHIQALHTNGTAISEYDFVSTPTNRFEFSWQNVSGGNQILQIFFDPDLAAANTPLWWLASHYQTNDYDAAAFSDTDQDGMSAWAEYFTGTDPTHADSVFRIIETGVQDGTNYVIWAGGGGTELPPFIIYRCTNLVDGIWEPIGYRNHTPNAAGNIWIDSQSPPAAFYRIGVVPL